MIVSTLSGTSRTLKMEKWKEELARHKLNMWLVYRKYLWTATALP